MNAGTRNVLVIRPGVMPSNTPAPRTPPRAASPPAMPQASDDIARADTPCSSAANGSWALASRATPEPGAEQADQGDGCDREDRSRTTSVCAGNRRPEHAHAPAEELRERPRLQVEGDDLDSDEQQRDPGCGHQAGHGRAVGESLDDEEVDGHGHGRADHDREPGQGQQAAERDLGGVDEPVEVAAEQDTRTTTKAGIVPSSPWAKFEHAGRAVDEGDAERDERVDAPDPRPLTTVAPTSMPAATIAAASDGRRRRSTRCRPGDAPARARPARTSGRAARWRRPRRTVDLGLEGGRPVMWWGRSSEPRLEGAGVLVGARAAVGLAARARRCRRSGCPAGS